MSVLLHDNHKSQCNYCTQRELDGDTTGKCRQRQLNAGLSVLLSWWLSQEVTSEIQFHIKCCCFCSWACLFILLFPLRVTVSHFLRLKNIQNSQKQSQSTGIKPPRLILRPSLCTSFHLSSSCALIRVTTFDSQQPLWHKMQRGWRVCATGEGEVTIFLPRIPKENATSLMVYLGVMR